MITLENIYLRLSITKEGAEMKSLIDLTSKREVLWQGDPLYWKGTSPILFPNTGRYWQGRFRHAGHEYEQGCHGFVRQRFWKILTQEATTVTLSYKSTEEDLSVYPFLFQIYVTYTLCEREVIVNFRVENLGKEDMIFQIGGHPGFNVRTYAEHPDNYGTIRLEGNPTHMLRSGDGGCIKANVYEVPVNEEGFIPATKDTFANEALIFENNEVKFVTLFDAYRRPLVTVNCPSPVTLIWTPPQKHAPFICIEPWYGLPDSIGFEGELSERWYTQKISQRSSWNGGYSFVIF